MKYIARFFLYTLLGWKAKGKFPSHLNKYVIIAAPHTHWIDFPLGITIKWAEGLSANFIGKASLFKPPFGLIFKWLGGAPIERGKSSNKVEAIVSIFNKREQFILALSPEGTRKKVDKWKTGFYYIAKGAGVPIVMTTLNFDKKEVKISEPYYPTDNMEEDFNHFAEFFKGAVGKKPEYT
ncbi:MAG TPA: 1-acyl-sn-glycerol-3-phosphate acyltransferase [Flavobacteriaceae bacterium]|nr:1-acyl-sn-glycerol-3-phosphate acyltransferase [Flavobacteriaceae bacterium]